MKTDEDIMARQELKVELGFMEAVSKRCPDNTHVLKVLGDLYTQCDRYFDGLRVDEQLSKLCPKDAEVWYNLGCSYSLVHRPEDAFDALHRAVDFGYKDYIHIIRDDDLSNIKDDPRFQELVDRVVS